MNNIVELCTAKNKETTLIAITGMCKNAGKTTFLNWLSSQLITQGDIAILTTGHDGEDVDLVSGNIKPKVNISAGTIFVTHSGILEKFAGSIEILEKTHYQAGMFKVWIVRALQDLKTEIIGPSTAKEQIQLCSVLEKYNPKYIIIDGSLDRKAITLHPEVDSIILLVSANYGNLEEIIHELKRLLLLTEVPKEIINVTEHDVNEFQVISEGKRLFSCTTLLGHEKEIIQAITDNQIDYLNIPGVITDSIWNKIKKNVINQKIKVIVNHPYQIQLTLNELQNLLDRVVITCRNQFIIDAIGINGYSVRGRHLDSEQLKKAVEKLTDIEVIDCMSVK